MLWQNQFSMSNRITLVKFRKNILLCGIEGKNKSCCGIRRRLCNKIFKKSQDEISLMNLITSWLNRN